jgi:hypothetical protein
MDLYVIAVVAVAFVLGGLVKGVVGMGLPTVALAVLGSAFGLHEALPLLVVPTFVTNVWQALFGGHLRAILQRFWPVLAGSVAGVVPGTWILFAVSAPTMNAALGVVLMVYALLGLVRLRVTIAPGAEPAVGPIVGLSSGLILGAAGTLVVPVGLYFEALKLEKDAFIQAMGLSFAVPGKRPSTCRPCYCPRRRWSPPLSACMAVSSCATDCPPKPSGDGYSSPCWRSARR